MNINELTDTDLELMEESLSLFKTKEQRAMVKQAKSGVVHRAAGELLTRVNKERRMRRAKINPTSMC